MLRILLIIFVDTSLIGLAAWHSLEMMLGAAALVVVLNGMFWMITKSTRPIEPESQSHHIPSEIFAQFRQKTQNTKPAQVPPRDAFSQFQKNLEASPKKKKPPKKKTPVPQAYTNSDFDDALTSSQATHAAEEAKDRVSISKPSKPTKKPAPSKKKVLPPKPTPEPDVSAEESGKRTLERLAQSFRQLQDTEDDLFPDVHVPLSSEKKTTETPAAPAEPVMDEGLGNVLGEPISQVESKMESQALLKMGQSAFQGGRYGEAKASLDNYFSLIEGTDESVLWSTKYMYAKVCLKEGDTQTAVTHFLQILENGIDAEEVEYVTILEEIMNYLEEAHQLEAALLFSQTLLNHYREQLDRVKMDHLYGQIERMLDTLGHDEKLIRTYKGHLEIKRVLKDVDGESQLLDLIGNRYYKMGEKELSRQYYEENLQLKE